MTIPLGCRECAEVVCSLEYYTGPDPEDRSVCPSCGGPLLDTQEAFDFIMHLKRLLEEAGIEYEYEEA